LVAGLAAAGAGFVTEPASAAGAGVDVEFSGAPASRNKLRRTVIIGFSWQIRRTKDAFKQQRSRI
jgi:hypothetical protein